jgi:hypothetical protein
MRLLNAIFPKTILEYHTPFTQNEVVRMLKEHIEPKQNLRRVDILVEHKKFEGTVEQDRFEISNIPDKNGYHACRISGEIYPAGKGARVVLQMTLLKSYTYAYILLPVLLAGFLAMFPFSKVQPDQVFPVYSSVTFGVLFVLAFPFFIAQKVKKVQKETGAFFDKLFDSTNRSVE